MLQPVFLAAEGHELPQAPRAGARKRLRLEGALGLRHVHQVARQALLAQHALDHRAIASRAAQSGLDHGPAFGALREKVQERQHAVVHRQRQVVRQILHLAFGAGAQSGVHRPLGNALSEKTRGRRAHRSAAASPGCSVSRSSAGRRWFRRCAPSPRSGQTIRQSRFRLHVEAALLQARPAPRRTRRRAPLKSPLWKSSLSSVQSMLPLGRAKSPTPSAGVAASGADAPVAPNSAATDPDLV